MFNYFIGIDIASDIHYACIRDKNYNIELKPFSFHNTLAGFEKLMAICSDYDNALFVMEATGIYYYNLFNYLNKLNQKVLIASPLSISKFRDSELLDNKTDPEDCKLIASYAIRKKDLKPTLYNPKDLQELRDITRLKRTYIEDLASIKNRIKGLLVLVFPEYARNINSVFGKSSLALLKEYPTADKLAHGHNPKVCRILRDNSRNRLGQQKADELIKCAKSSSASRSGTTYEQMMLSQLENLEGIESLVASLDSRIEILMESLNSHLDTIPGIGPTLAAELLGEIGDVERFEKPASIVKYAGLNSPSKQSGNTDTSDKQHITKRGNIHLRRALFQAAEKAAKYDPELHQYYKKKKAEGKHHYVIITAISRKLTKRIYTILTEHREYIIHDVDIDSN